MNKQQRAEQLQIADERMSQLNNANWLQQHPAADVKGDGWIEVGKDYSLTLQGLSGFLFQI